MTNADLSYLQGKMTSTLTLEGDNIRVDNPVGISLTPKLLKKDVYDQIKSDCEFILEAIETLVQEFVRTDLLREIFPELEGVHDLISRPTSFDRAVWLARFDVVEAVDGSFKIVETNCNCPGGLTRVHTVDRAFRSLPNFH